VIRPTRRYDTLGSTVYIWDTDEIASDTDEIASDTDEIASDTDEIASDTDEIASLRRCSPAMLTLGAKHPLQKDADFVGMTLDVYMRSVIAEWGITWGPGSWPSTGATAGVSTSSPSAALAGGLMSSIRIRSRRSAPASANSCTPSLASRSSH
jgi:hypothetical protein